MLLLDLGLRPVRTFGPDAVSRLATQLGVEGIAVGPDTVTLGELEALLPAAFQAGAPVQALAAPTPAATLPTHKRLPSLCADDADERAGALALVGTLAEQARTFAIGRVTLSLGFVPLAVAPAAFRRAFDRRAWREEAGFGFAPSPDAALGSDAFAERQGRSSRLLDAARFSLEKLVDLADRHGLTFLLEVAGTPWEFPGPREALTLLGEFHGSPLALVWDPARLAVLHTLGLGQTPTRLAELAARAGLARFHDAVGVEVGYLPGLGVPLTGALAAIAPPVAVPWVVAGRSDTTEAELAEAIVALRREKTAAVEREEARRAAAATPVKPGETSARG